MGLHLESVLRTAGKVGMMSVLVVVPLAGVVASAGQAVATPTLTVTPPTTLLMHPNTTTALDGLAVSGDTAGQLQVTVATTMGTLSVGTTTDLALAYANTWTGAASVTFDGTQGAIDTALGSVALTAGSATGEAQVSLTAMVAQAGYNYLASNEHFYQYVPCAACNWSTADTDASAMSFAGQPGYLATIPSAAVNNFISSDIANASDVWFGARAYESIATDGTAQYATVNGTTYPRVWRWTEGSDESPIAGQLISECANQLTTCQFRNSSDFYSSWAAGEPNNNIGSSTVAYQGEYTAVTNWAGTLGAWNDLSPTDDSGIAGYVVEYGGKNNTNASLGTGFAGVVTASSDVLVATAASVPNAPHISVAARDTSAVVRWTAPASNGAAISGYRISTDGGATWTAATVTSSTTVIDGNDVTTVSTTLSDLNAGNNYSLEVEAVNSAGPSSASNTVTVVTSGAPSLTPTSASYTAEAGRREFRYVPPAPKGGTGPYRWSASNLPPGVTQDPSTGALTGDATVGGVYTSVLAATDANGQAATQTVTIVVVSPQASHPTAATPDGGGYWVTTTAGAVSAFGDARSYGSVRGTPSSPIVGLASTPDGAGYWLVAASGKVLAFGDAGFHGSLPVAHLNRPVVGIVATPDGRGYWLVAGDGGVFSFGDAAFLGSTGDRRINAPIVGMAATPDGGGYWLVGADGGIFTFGNSVFRGSAASLRLNAPVTGMAVTPKGRGYWLVSADGGVFSFGDALFHGSMVAGVDAQPVP